MITFIMTMPSYLWLEFLLITRALSMKLNVIFIKEFYSLPPDKNVFESLEM